MKKLLFALLFVSSSVFASNHLSISANSIQPRIVPKNATAIPILQVNLTAGDETIYVKKLVFNRTGLSSAQDIKSIRATGSNIRSRSFPMLYNDTATINFFKKLIIPANTTQTFTITANLNIQGTGRTIGLDLVEVISTATETNFHTEKITPPGTPQVSQTSSIDNKIIEIDKLNFKPSRLRLERWQKLGKFRLRNLEDKPANLDSIYLQHDGVGDLRSIYHQLILTSQQRIISQFGEISPRSAHFTFLDNTTVRANSDRLLEVWGKVKRNKSTYTVDFRADNDDIVTK